jgi:hypothetical protein
LLAQLVCFFEGSLERWIGSVSLYHLLELRVGHVHGISLSIRSPALGARDRVALEIPVQPPPQRPYDRHSSLILSRPDK